MYELEVPCQKCEEKKKPLVKNRGPLKKQVRVFLDVATVFVVMIEDYRGGRKTQLVLLLSVFHLIRTHILYIIIVFILMPLYLET